MGYYISNLFGIRSGGVFSGAIDTDDINKRITKVAKQLSTSVPFEDWSGCTSGELTATKGSYITIAGVFNYWSYNLSSQFACALSVEFGVEVLHMCWNEEEGEVQCQIWLIGKPLFEILEDPIGRILRRVAG